MRTTQKQYVTQYTNDKCETIKHEDNYHLLKLLLPVQLFEGVIYTSTVVNRPLLKIHVLKSFKYTTEIELSYIFKSHNSEKIILRSYEDAKVAEIVYCTDVQQFIRLLGPKIKPQVHLKTRASLNIFLAKLLHYLLKSGYNHNHWQQIN
jgi:uncharacterized protein YqiB (DUF1249 family)